APQTSVILTDTHEEKSPLQTSTPEAHCASGVLKNPHIFTDSFFELPMHVRILRDYLKGYARSSAPQPCLYIPPATAPAYFHRSAGTDTDAHLFHSPRTFPHGPRSRCHRTCMRDRTFPPDLPA